MSGFESWPTPILRRWLLSAAAGPIILLIGLTGRIALRDPAATALTTAFLRQIRLLIPASCREKVRIAIAPDFLHEQTVLAARCIIFLHLGTIIVAAAMALTAWKEASSWNIPSAN